METFWRKNITNVTFAIFPYLYKTITTGHKRLKMIQMIVRKRWTQHKTSTSRSRMNGDSCKVDKVTFIMFAMQSIIINWFTVVFSTFQSLTSTLKFSSRVSKPNGIIKHRKIGSILLLNISVFSMLSISPSNIISWLVVLANIVTEQERTS